MSDTYSFKGYPKYYPEVESGAFYVEEHYSTDDAAIEHFKEIHKGSLQAVVKDDGLGGITCIYIRVYSDF